jgi:hypothetical protein
MLRKWSASFNYHPNDIIDMLSKIGYKCYFIEKNSLEEITEVTEETVQTNFIFLDKVKHMEIIKKMLV